MSILKLENVTLSYGEKNIIENFNLSVNAGETVSIIGPNASGKSTILKSIAGILKPKTGAVYIGGTDISKLSAKSLAEKVAVLLQQNTGPEEITVEELVYFGRYPRKKWFKGYGQKDRAVTEKVMRLTNTFSIKDKVLDNLSGGERQRAWIAMCLAQEPSVILFDEPTVYLDLAHQIEFFKLIADLKKETEAAIILVLHDLNQAAKYGNYLVAIKNGTVFAEGKPEAVLTRGNINAIYNIDSEIIKTEDGFFVIPK